MEKIYKGGYAEVFYDHETEEIFRTLPKYHADSKELDISTIADLIFTRSLEYTGLTPVIHSETVDKDQVTFRMPYYGLPLHQWIRKTPLEERKRQAGYLLYQIVTGCLYFEKNGFMHTDLKPSNIMVSQEEDLRVRIIDFNCISVREIHPEDPTLEWASAVGTWNYCPPEIILYETPYHTTPSWSIGLLAAAILDKYAFADSITPDIKMDQEVWCDLMDHWYVTYPEHPPLLRKDNYGEPWHQLIYGSTKWCTNARWSLSKIQDYIYGYLLEEADRKRPWILLSHDIHPISYIIQIPPTDANTRERAITTLYTLCEHMKNENLFPTAMAILDRCAPLLHEEMLLMIEKVIAGAYFLSCAMYNQPVFSSRSNMSKVMKHVGCIHPTIVIKYMYTLADLLSWRLWEKPAHIWITEMDRSHIHHENLYPYLRDAFLSQKGSYTQKEIAEMVIARIHREGGTPTPSD